MNIIGSTIVHSTCGLAVWGLWGGAVGLVGGSVGLGGGSVGLLRWQFGNCEMAVYDLWGGSV